MTKRSLATDKVTLKIPRPLYDKISRVIDGTGYNSVTDFVVYVMRDLMSGHSDAEKGTYTQEEMATIKDRLKNLGYL
jgi:Arc/MetJ-type ribon-helix-helix transcriptional regulator